MRATFSIHLLCRIFPDSGHNIRKLINKVIIQMKTLLPILPILALLSLSGCSALPLQESASLVRLTLQEPSAENCKFLGDVTGSQGDFFRGGFTSNADLETGARHDIKNKADAMGGNLVYLLTQRAGQTGSYNQHAGGTQQTNVTLSGNVYFCGPPMN